MAATSPEGVAAGGVLVIDAGALAANYRALAARARPAACAGVVKANGYGLGIEVVAPTLWAAGCRRFFVATLGEGERLRALLPAAWIAVLDGALPGAEPAFAAARLHPVLNSLDQIARWQAHARAGGPREAIVHIDTGMNRLGLGADEVACLAAEPARLADLDLILVMSHLACAEDVGAAMNEAQRARFDALRAKLPPAPASLANSSALFLGPAYHYDLVRPGVALYGVNPTPGQPNPQREVVRVQGKIVQLREIDSAQTVGYGATRRLAAGTRLATVAVGYADGYLRALSNRAYAAVGDQRVPVVGRVSMDLITIDVSAAPPLAPGHVVDLIGGAVPIDEVAAWGDTIAYELLVALGDRFERRVIGGVAA